MAEASSSPSSPAVSPPLSSSMKENRVIIGSTLADLDKSQSELVSRLQGLKQEMQNWRSKLDTQVKTYKDELSQLKSSLGDELEQLRSEFQDLRVTLQQQQEDVTNSLKTLGLQDVSKDPEDLENPDGDKNLKAEDDQDVHSPKNDSTKEVES